jgi:hypothetical protein
MGSKDTGGVIDNVQKVMTVALAIAAAATGWAVNKANTTLAGLDSQESRDKVFSEDLFTQLPTLSAGGPKAKMVFVGLWVLAHDAEAKNGLIQVAAVSDEKDLKTIADALTQKGYSQADIDSSQTLVNAKAALIAQVSAAYPRPSPKVDPKATGASADLLANLTPANASGYIFLGTATSSNKQLHGATTDRVTIPSPGDSITPLSDVHLRDGYPSQTELGQVIGIVDQTDLLKVDDIKTYSLSKNAEAVWAHVTVLERPSPGPTTAPR